jgi:hypothetical protein
MECIFPIIHRLVKIGNSIILSRIETFSYFYIKNIIFVKIFLYNIYHINKYIKMTYYIITLNEYVYFLNIYHKIQIYSIFNLLFMVK